MVASKRQITTELHQNLSANGIEIISIHTIGLVLQLNILTHTLTD